MKYELELTKGQLEVIFDALDTELYEVENSVNLNPGNEEEFTTWREEIVELKNLIDSMLKG